MPITDEILDVIGGPANASSDNQNTNTNANTNENTFNFADFLKGAFEGAFEQTINLGASEHVADAYTDAADKALDYQYQVHNDTRDDLEPYRTAGEASINAGLLDQATSDLSLDPFNLNPVNTGVSTETGIDPRLWQGFEGLTDLEAKTGQWGDANLITRGSDEYNLLTDDAIQNVMNQYTARGKSNTNEAKDNATRAMIRAIGDIENINNSRLNQEMSKRASDLGVSEKQRSTEAYEQLTEGDTFFAQQSAKREQMWKELFSEGQTEIENMFRDNDQRMTRRSQVLQELLGTDAQTFSKLMEIANMGGNAAARTGSINSGLAPNVADIYGGVGAVNAGNASNQAEVLKSILSGMF